MPRGIRGKAGWRHLTGSPLQLVLSVLGVALGVAVMVAMDLAIQSSREAFRVSSETVAGRATHQLLGGVTGVPDSLPAQLRIDVGLRAVAPVVEGYVTSPRSPDRPLRLLGIDPFAEGPFRPWLVGGSGADLDGTALMATAGAVVLSGETAGALGVEEGEALPVSTPGAGSDLRVVGVFEAQDRSARLGLRDLLVVDIAEAQERLGREGHLDRVDLILPAGPEEAPTLARIRDLLPPDVRLEPAGSREATMQEMIRAFDINLTALSLLALVFGVFLIYNTMTFSVLRRRSTLGTLRALGVTRAQVIRSILAEAALLGAAGAFLGVAVGILLGRGLVRFVTRTINDLYFVVSVEGLALPPGVLAKGVVLGVVATVLAALPPAWEAGTVTPRDALARSAVEGRARRALPGVTGIGVLLLLAGVGLLVGSTSGLVVAFAGLFLLILGMALLTPVSMVLMAELLRPGLRRTAGVLGAMAARGIVTSLSRTAPAVAALVIAVSVTVGLGVMIHSFRGSVSDWLEVTLQADLYVSSPSVIASRAGGQLPTEFPGRVGELAGVEGVSTYRGSEVRTEYGPARLVVVDLDPGREAGIDLMSGVGPSDQVMDEFRRGAGILVSEPFSQRHGVAPGDTVSLAGGEGPFTVGILGVFRDYGSEMGTLMLSRELYDRYWDDPRVTSMGVYVSAAAAEARVAEQIRGLADADRPLVVRSNRELREASLEVFDRTFAVTRVLRVLAFAVAFIAVLSALMALQLERRREFGVLRANGMTPGQTWGLVLAQTGLMGAIAGILALPVGLVLAYVMIFVVNRRSFGWTLDMLITPGLLAQAVGLALLGALLAGIYPAWRMSRASLVEALRGE